MVSEICHIISRNKSRRQQIPQLWIVLFGITNLAWTFALSGLTMSLYSGFKAGNIAGVNVLGANPANFNFRTFVDMFNTTCQQWTADILPNLPLNAALYVPPGSSIVPNVSTSNDFPDDASSGIFLGPQASVPVTGNLWGLYVTYNCSEVDSQEQFTILDRRINSSNPAYISPTVYLTSSVDYFYSLDDGSSISVLPGLDVDEQGPQSPFSPSFAEIGMSTGLRSIMINSSLYTYAPLQSTWGGFGDYIPTFQGLDKQELFEMIVWQILPGDNYTVIQNTIPGLGYEPLLLQGQSASDQSNTAMPAIGIRCVSSSVTGTADINGLAGTFTNFTREVPAQSANSSSGGALNFLPRLSFGVSLMVGPLNQNLTAAIGSEALFSDELHRYGNYSVDYTIFNKDLDWMSRLNGAANIPLSISENDPYVSNYTAVMQSSDLKTVILNAYKQYAYSLMFYAVDSPSELWVNSNVTAVVPWPLIQSGGGVPPLVVIVLIWLWAVACAALSIVYGFRKRYSATFDDFQLYCYCQERHLDPLEVLKS